MEIRSWFLNEYFFFNTYNLFFKYICKSKGNWWNRNHYRGWYWSLPRWEILFIKKNVVINSDNFILNAENVKINFKNNLHDITELNAKGNVKFNSSEFNIKGIGDNLRFEVENEKITIKGIDSKLQTEDIEMYSDGLMLII